MTATEVFVLAADVGGTNTKTALARVHNGRPRLIKRHSYSSHNYATLERALEAFLADPDVRPHAARIRAACFAVAGPVEAGRARLTNLTWQIDEAQLRVHFGFPRVALINDFAAAGLGVALLEENDLLTLQPGVPIERAPRVVVGAGTGLGVGLLSWSEGHYDVHASEAGHCDFAPMNQLQDDLLVYLRREFGHVSYERIVSGPGLPRIFAFLKGAGAGEPGAVLAVALRERDPAQAITEFALARLDPLAERTLEIFVSVYGAFAGNMALVTLAHGGVFIAGGIAPKIAPKLTDGTFLRAFNVKGRFQKLLETMPVKVVMNEHVGLYGALAEAARVAA